MESKNRLSAEDLRRKKSMQKKLNRLNTFVLKRNENLKRLKITQSVKAGHIRGGHGLH